MAHLPSATFFRAGRKKAAMHTLDAPTAPVPQSTPPVYAQYDAQHIVISSGIAIFHLASRRVVLCYHSVDKYWFLPKGRRDAGEEGGEAAIREGFEESGYRNRLLPLPVKHRQPKSHHTAAPRFSTEPVWTQLMPVAANTIQYLLFWYIGETLPPDVEEALNASVKPAGQSADGEPNEARPMPYILPPAYPPILHLADRMKQDGADYEPPRHQGTGVDEEEALYESYLVPVDEAIKRLGKSVMADVVRLGWKYIQVRLQEEGTEGPENEALAGADV